LPLKLELPFLAVFYATIAQRSRHASSNTACHLNLDRQGVAPTIL